MAGRPGRKDGIEEDEAAGLRRRLAEQEETIAALERRVAELEASQKELAVCRRELGEVRERYEGEEARVTDLIGCLDDCVSDPEELRERCACARRTEDRP